ncbi:MAG: RNA polymerase sigma factor [Acidobacteriota bacterium]
MTSDTSQLASDIELARAAAVGDRNAFETIYHRHYRRVYSLCFRMTTNAAEAEDLTQDVFIQVFRRIGSYRGEAAFSTWLHRLTVNQVLMRFRKRDLRFETTTDQGELPTIIEPGSERPAAMPIIEHIALEKAIAQLSPGYRAVFVLHDVEGYEHEEIANMLGVTVGTSKSQLHKARLKLRALLLSEKV